MAEMTIFMGVYKGSQTHHRFTDKKQLTWRRLPHYFRVILG